MVKRLAFSAGVGLAISVQCYYSFIIPGVNGTAIYLVSTFIGFLAFGIMMIHLYCLDQIRKDDNKENRKELCSKATVIELRTYDRKKIRKDTS